VLGSRVIQANDGITAYEKCLRDMAANEACSTGYQKVLFISIDLITARLSIAETELFHRFRARVGYLVEHLSPGTEHHSLYAVYRVTTRDGAQSD